MPLLTDVGPYSFLAGRAVSGVSYVPPADRDLEVVGLLVMNPSADDNWSLQIAGRELQRYRVTTTGTQNVLGSEATALSRLGDFFSWYKNIYGEEFIIPVPSGVPFQLVSLGGATADVSVRFRDMTRGSLNSSMPNHYQGNRYLQLRYGYLNAVVAAVGEHNVDTEVGTPFLPNIFTGVPIPAGWTVNIRALWLEAASVNTFSGAANHVSSTDHWSYMIDQEPLFTHVIAGDTSGSPKGFSVTPGANLVSPGGITAWTNAAAAGAANTVYGRGDNPFPAFQAMTSPEKNMLDPGIQLRQGDTPQLAVNIQGDVTGNPDYHTVEALALVEYLRQS